MINELIRKALVDIPNLLDCYNSICVQIPHIIVGS